MARSIKISDSFTREVEIALEHYADAGWLGERSPLAAPYFLGNVHSEASDTPAAHGRALQSALIAASKSLSLEQQALLNASFFRRDPVLNNVGVALSLGMAETTYYRHRVAAIEAMADEVNREASPPWRPEMPGAQMLIGRESLRQSCASLLRDGRTIALNGTGGIGKTALGADLARERGDAFWYTIRPGLNDHLNGVVFALAHFLRERKATATWRQLVADRGVADPARALGLLRHDMASLQHKPVLCVDEFDLLRDESGRHAQIVYLLEALRGTAPMLLIGQRVLIEADHHHVLVGLNVEETDALLRLKGVSPLHEGDAESARAHTRGNPALLSLIASLWREDHRLGDLFKLIAYAPSVEPLLHRIWKRMGDEERSLLMALSVFEGAAPRDAWPDQQESLEALIGRELIQADEGGGLLMPMHVRAFVQQRVPAEAVRSLHLAAGEVFEARGDYTTAAFHYARSSRPSLAVWTWFNHRAIETDRGRAPAAREIFRRIEDQSVANEDDRRTLALLRAELALAAGAGEEAETELSRVTWPIALSATPLARQLQGDALEMQGRIDQALEAYRTAWRALDVSPVSHAVSLLIRSGYIHVNRDPDLQQARQDATLAMWQAHHFMGHVQRESGDSAGTELSLNAALRIADGLPNNKVQLARTHQALSALFVRTSRFEDAIAHAQSALQLDEVLGDTVNMLFDKLNLSSALIVAKRYDEALALTIPAVMQAGEINHAFLACALQASAAEACFYLSRLDDAERYAMLALQQEEAVIRPYALTTLGWVKLARADPAAAASLLTQAIESALETGDRYAEAPAWKSLGDAHVALGDLAASCDAFQHALDLYEALNLGDEADRLREIMK